MRLYQEALGQQGNLTLDPSYRPCARPRFERAVREFKEWLEATRDAIEPIAPAEEPRSPTE